MRVIKCGLEAWPTRGCAFYVAAAVAPMEMAAGRLHHDVPASQAELALEVAGFVVHDHASEDPPIVDVAFDDVVTASPLPAVGRCNRCYQELQRLLVEPAGEAR